MLRLFYRWLLRFHPARFRERFAEEMVSIFDHVEGRAATAELVADAFISLVRQWTIRSEYWEEKVSASVPAGVGGFPVFYTLESFKPRKSALIGGAVLTWIACSAVFLAIRHSKIHSIYLPSVSFEPAASANAQLPAGAPNLPPTQASVHPRTQSAAIEARANSSEADRPSLGKVTSSEPNSSARVSVSQEQARLDARTKSSEQDRSSPGKAMPSEANSSARVSVSREQAGLDARGKLGRTITTPPLVQSLSQPVAPTKIRKETFHLYVGVYSTDVPNKLTVLVTAQDGRLAIEVPGEQKSMLVHVHGARFAFSEAQNNWIEFMKNDNGAVYGLQISLNGSESRWLRKVN
jgi:hypothetical protein